jgi:ribulose 1,5-bisphosphate synthetase/thiazole synthase
MLTIAGATVIRRITIAMTMFAEALALVRAAQLTQGEQEPVDVIIVGAGIAGLSTALEAANSPSHIAYDRLLLSEHTSADPRSR